jgi:hypothetical protein
MGNSSEEIVMSPHDHFSKGFATILGYGVGIMLMGALYWGVWKATGWSPVMPWLWR